MSPAIHGALSRVTARVVGSRFAKPIARVVLVAAGLALLAIIGRAGATGAFGTSAAAATSARIASEPDAAPLAAPEALPLVIAASPAAPPHHGAASTDDPVILNTASTEDLRRLPGIGEKRASAILSLRMRLGRFRAIEDLLKVKGIGRAMLKRIRPLVRLDPALVPTDAGGASGARPGISTQVSG